MRLASFKVCIQYETVTRLINNDQQPHVVVKIVICCNLQRYWNIKIYRQLVSVHHLSPFTQHIDASVRTFKILLQRQSEVDENNSMDL